MPCTITKKGQYFPYLELFRSAKIKNTLVFKTENNPDQLLFYVKTKGRTYSVFMIGFAKGFVNHQSSSKSVHGSTLSLFLNILQNTPREKVN